MATTLAMAGYAIGEDLPGIDRPGIVSEYFARHDEMAAQRTMTDRTGVLWRRRCCAAISRAAPPL
ncbi:hypothetical protein IRT45_14250 [Nocardia sp. BSTN01]|uniref:hypothetical protein n=1 Tax=Nocardia sp. BSTN01 TaxID=2783665 RepID=UPI0018903798|nr:hypothetical protein [Nocardia sp. BSTN01]MBF4998313.1 hypothetical protein [Nocardia sp. BSTN01]